MPDINIILNPDGSAQFAIPEGMGFDEAREKLKDLQKILESEGIPFDGDGMIEQHRHDLEKVRTNVRAGGPSFGSRG